MLCLKKNLVRRTKKSVISTGKTKLQNEMKTLQKGLKMKEKEIYRLQRIEDNAKDTIKRLKNKFFELSSENKL